MIRKFTSLLAAILVAMATLAPAAADARDRRGGHGYYDGDRRGGYDNHRRHYRDRDNGDEVAAGVLGLVLGVAIGSMVAQSSRDDRSYDRRQQSQRCYDPCSRDGYYYDQDYDPYYDDQRAQYEDDYDRGGQCMQQMRRWDSRSQSYVIVEVPC